MKYSVCPPLIFVLDPIPFMWAQVRFALIVVGVAVMVTPYAFAFFIATVMAMSDSPAAASQFGAWAILAPTIVIITAILGISVLVSKLLRCAGC